MKTLDLNCDMGEGFGAWKMGEDAALLDNVTSANIACGFHAGDPGTMRTHGFAGDEQECRTRCPSVVARPAGLRKANHERESPRKFAT